MGWRLALVAWSGVSKVGIGSGEAAKGAAAAGGLLMMREPCEDGGLEVGGDSLSPDRLENVNVFLKLVSQPVNFFHGLLFLLDFCELDGGGLGILTF